MILQPDLHFLNSVRYFFNETENASAYELYRWLSYEQKKKLFEAVVVFDLNPTLSEIDNDIRQELYFAVRINTMLS